MVAPNIDALEFTFEEYVINYNDPDPQPEPAPQPEPMSVPTFEVDGLDGARVIVAALPRLTKTATGYASGEKVMFTDRP